MENNPIPDRPTPDGASDDRTPTARHEIRTETDLVKSIRLAAGRGNVRLFRNNVGQARTETGAVIVYGLCSGSSDLIGWVSRTVTADMVGQKVAIFTALEVKKAGRYADKDQRNFIRVVKEAGGIADVVRSVEEAKGVVDG